MVSIQVYTASISSLVSPRVRCAVDVEDTIEPAASANLSPACPSKKQQMSFERI